MNAPLRVPTRTRILLMALLFFPAPARIKLHGPDFRKVRDEILPGERANCNQNLRLRPSGSWFWTLFWGKADF
jgi:hypothetical protein